MCSGVISVNDEVAEVEKKDVCSGGIYENVAVANKINHTDNQQV